MCVTVCDSESVLAVYVLADFETLSVQCTVYSVLYSVHCTLYTVLYFEHNLVMNH